MEYPFNTETIEHCGVTVRIEYFHDSDRGFPWDNDEGCGPVRKSNHRHGVNWSTNGDKKPGERPLNCPNRNEYQFYYDWQEAMKIAKRDGWNAEPYDAPNKALRAVKDNFDYCRGFLNDDWHYAGIVCTVLDSDGDETDETDSCWGFETLNNYHETEGKAMAEALAESCQKENQNVLYWASRDVVTVGVSA